MAVTDEKGHVVAVAYRNRDDAVFTISSGDIKQQVNEELEDIGELKHTKSPSRGFFPLKNMARHVRNLFHNTKILVHVFVCVFAIASWVDINGMWAELPLLTQESLPEGWNLPSYLIIISQVGNLGPLLFALVSYLAPQSKPKLEKVVSFIIIIISMVASILIGFLWKRTTYVGGTQHSTAFLALSFFLAIGDCTSSVSFYAFMAHLKAEYMPALFIGEGLSGMLPAMIALGQGAGEIRCNGTHQLKTLPNFSVQTFFFILSAIIALSAISFLLLNFWGYCQSEMVLQSESESEKIIHAPNESASSYGAVADQNRLNTNGDASVAENVTQHSQEEQTFPPNGHIGSSVSLTKSDMSDTNSTAEVLHNSSLSFTSLKHSVKNLIKMRDMPLWTFFFLMVIIFIINLTVVAFLPTIQIYSVLPYGLEYYHLTTTLPAIANPLACFLTLFVIVENPLILLVMTALGEACVAYIIYVAAKSPNPPLSEDSTGGILAVALWVVLIFLLTYGKSCVAGIMRKQGRNALICVGVVTQSGTLIGAIVGFLLTSHYKIFVPAPFCQ